MELYYTDKVRKEEAEKLGNYLIESGFDSNDNTKTVQITKVGSTYQFRLVVMEGYEKDSEYLEIVKIFAKELSDKVFNGENVEIHLCDEFLITLNVVKMQ